MVNRHFWKGKKVFLTGHTGFKGSWLVMWLNELGAEVTGYALQAPTNPSLFEICKIENCVHSITGDIRDRESLIEALVKSDAEIVFHLAAQPLVRESYINPIETYEVNVMGTLNLLEGIKHAPSVKALVNVTTDKCYENKEWIWGYREDESLGGYDPYSSSKACSEIVTAAYRSSYFNLNNNKECGVGIATARAGNVIGGGDWAKDRLIPDILNAIINQKPVCIRNPRAIRPWQHVLEPLNGYLVLAQKLYENPQQYSSAWNFGPRDEDAKEVDYIVKKLHQEWGAELNYQIDDNNQPHEAHYLKLDSSKSKTQLSVSSRWDLDTSLCKIVQWTKAYNEGEDMRLICKEQINAYMNS